MSKVFMRLRMVLLFTVSLYLFFFVGISSISAQEDVVGLTISPTSFELNADPGDSLVNEMKVYNPTNDPLSVNIKVEDFYPVGEEGQVALQEPGENSTFSLASWTTALPAEFILQPGEQQIVTFNMNLPVDAEPGGHYGSIVASLSGATQLETGSSVGNDRGSLVLLRISGNIEEELVVDTFFTESFREYGPVDFNLKFDNVGNVHVKPVGFVTITDFSGNEVAQLEIPQNNVIPGAVRIADVAWDESKPIGRFTATLVANYGSGSQEVITDSITFIVFPWKLALAILGGVIVVVVMVVKSRARLSKAAKALAGK